MKIWYDACTGKHVRYGVAIARRLRRKGHNLILTTRKHPDTIKLAEYLGEKFHVVGRYVPTSRNDKLRESLRRQLLFYEMFKDNIPDIAVSHHSVELCRVAFGFGVPIISTHDSPHADAVNRLTMPLINVLIVSKAIPKKYLRKYGAQKIVQFNGVDEIAWMKNFKVKMKFEYESPLIVVRQLEIGAAYVKTKVDITEKLAEKLLSVGNVVFLSRYQRKPKKGLIVPKKFVDSASLVAQSDLVVSVGGTIAREAALAGTPSIVVPVLGRFHINNYRAKMGFPIFTVKAEKVVEYAKKVIGKRYNVTALLEKLENPVDVIERVVENLGSEKVGDD